MTYDMITLHINKKDQYQRVITEPLQINKNSKILKRQQENKQGKQNKTMSKDYG